MSTIYESFEKLDEAKKQKILNAGFKVFAEHGYKKSSVDAIVKEADISKGSLFYYFESKKNFFLYLYEYCGLTMELLVDRKGPDGLPAYMQYTDFFERITAIQNLKKEYGRQYPYIHRFIKKTVFDQDPAIHKEIQAVNQRYASKQIMDFFHNIDISKFKDGIDPKMVLQLVSWCQEGCANLMQQNQMNKRLDKLSDHNFQEALELFQSYMEFMRNHFYKEEYL